MIDLPNLQMISVSTTVLDRRERDRRRDAAAGPRRPRRAWAKPAALQPRLVLDGRAWDCCGWPSPASEGVPGTGGGVLLPDLVALD